MNKKKGVHPEFIVREMTPDGQMAEQKDAQATLPALCTSSDGHLSM